MKIAQVLTYAINRKHFLEYYMDDPYEVPKKMGIYHVIPSENSISIDTIIQRIISNRQKHIETQKKKEQKLQHYYKNEDFTVKEVILGEEKKETD